MAKDMEDIIYMLGQIDSKVTGLQTDLTEMRGEHKSLVETVKEVKEFQDDLKGRVAVISAIFGIVGGFIIKVIFGKWGT